MDLGDPAAQCIFGPDIPALTEAKPLCCIADYDGCHGLEVPVLTVPILPGCWLKATRSVSDEQFCRCSEALLLRGAGRCGVPPGRAAPASHQDQVLCVAVCSPGPYTSSWPDVILGHADSCTLFCRCIVHSWLNFHCPVSMPLGPSDWGSGE